VCRLSGQEEATGVVREQGTTSEVLFLALDGGPAVCVIFGSITGSFLPPQRTEPDSPVLAMSQSPSP
jgi:hypothetical protein